MLNEKILYYLKAHENSYVSGEDLSKEMGISRTSIWKHIEILRDEGYEIEASPHLGYKLIGVPDRLTAPEITWGLGTDIVGKKVYAYTETGSTNDVAYELALNNASEGIVVVAEYQTHGRGRFGRKWVSPRGKGIYLSIILRPGILPNEIPSITLFSALGVAQTIYEVLNLDASIRWPNDILINNRKVCGILTEMNAESDRVNFVIVGIGINVNSKKELLPNGATSLMEEKGCQVSRLDVVRRLLINIERQYKIFKSGRIGEIIKEYKKFAGFIGKRVRVTYYDASIEGYAIDIDRDGALILRMDSGLNERIVAGDVVMLR